MPRNQKDSQNHEAEEERDDVAAPEVEDEEVDADDRTRAKFGDDEDEEADDEDLAEDLDLDDLSAMEGPDA